MADKKLEDLTQEELVKAFKEAQAAHQKALAEKDAQLKQSEEIHQKALAAKDEEIKQVTADAETIIDELKAEVAAKSHVKVLPVVKVGKKAYRFTAQTFIFRRQQYSADEAVGDEKLLAALVEAKTDVLVEHE